MKWKIIVPVVTVLFLTGCLADDETATENTTVVTTTSVKSSTKEVTQTIVETTIVEEPSTLIYEPPAQPEPEIIQPEVIPAPVEAGIGDTNTQPQGFFAPPAPAPSANYANCSEARAAGAAPIYAGSPGYSSKLDRDGDGVACE